jgi:hypothetical protein
MRHAILIASVAALLLATGVAHADDAAIRICDKRFQAGELQPGDEIGACYAKATNNRCDGDLGRVLINRPAVSAFGQTGH